MLYLASDLAGEGNLESGRRTTWSDFGKAAARHLSDPSTKGQIERGSSKRVANEEAVRAGSYVAVSAVVRDLKPRGAVREFGPD